MNWKSICLTGALLCAVSHMTAFAVVTPAHDRAALVDGAAITSAEFHAELERLGRQRGVGKKNPDPAVTARLKKEALENLIIRELLYREAKKQGIKAPASAVDAEMNDLKKQFNGESEYQITLGRMGLSEATVRAQVEKGMAVKKFIDANFADKVKVTDEDIAFYYEDHHDEFKVASQKPTAFTPLSEVREKIRRKIKQERVEKALSPYLKKLRDTAKVEILLDEDAD